jgi:hypothetical protein
VERLYRYRRRSRREIEAHAAELANPPSPDIIEFASLLLACLRLRSEVSEEGEEWLAEILLVDDPREALWIVEELQKDGTEESVLAARYVGLVFGVTSPQRRWEIFTPVLWVLTASSSG